MKTKMHVEKNNIEQMLFGMEEICRSMLQTACEDTAEEIIRKRDDLSVGDNAVLYVHEYADMLRGVFNVMSGGLGIITDGIANDEIKITVNG